MIKRIRFATRAEDVGVQAFSVAWRRAVAGAAQAPPEVRPSRVVVCTTLPELTGPDPRHDGIGIEWFADAAHLKRFERWLGTEVPAPGILDPQASPVVVAEEAVPRGAGWLERRWRDGGDKLKHLAIAVRASALTPAEFSQRWRSHAGTVGATVIPDDARGCAYVQNHPLATGEWAYDALNEVYFDDVAGLRTRIEWFRDNLRDQAADLVSRSWFLAVREEVVTGNQEVVRA